MTQTLLPVLERLRWPQAGQAHWMALRQDGGVLLITSDGLPRGPAFHELWRSGIHTTTGVDAV